jgi:hypothetical protein
MSETFREFSTDDRKRSCRNMLYTVKWQLKAGTEEQIKEAIARQECSKNISAATYKPTTEEFLAMVIFYAVHAKVI